MSGRKNQVSRRAVVGGMIAAPMLNRGASAQAPLTVTWGEDDAVPRTYDPRVTSSRHEYQVIGQMFDTLVASDGSNKLYPGLATAWEAAADGKSVTLKLRSDVGFHDGTPFDAEAVKFTFDTIADPKTASEGAVTQLGPYAGSKVIDPHTPFVLHVGSNLRRKNREGVLLEIWNALHRRTGCAAVLRKIQNHRYVPPNVDQLI